ncbi:LysE family translocator [Dictyobacter aurantiacus]|uniref:Lysine transporter LysE n=1 Tax=Dictyobacter aurantiacus TaxID=1936993 RepID=A0A401ZMJ2_9CHLR|nr:LysE family translocator [Dictyobacter aurantiacus]GCE08044.1 lysine transporter LysE [Dictyobacter aurantiacus]
MDFSFLLRGLLIGLSVAAVVGPMSVLCMQRTLNRGFRYGFISGLGVACGDAVYGCIAGFGLTVIAGFLVRQQGWVRLVGGLFLVYLGIKTMLTRPAQQAASTAKSKGNGLLGAYVSTFLLTLTNPVTILSFAAIFAGLGVGSGNSNFVNALLVVSGVFLGSALWWLFLTAGISLVRGRFNARWLLWINRLSGLVITIFGVIALISLYR